MMTPMPNDEHQDIVGALTSILREVVQLTGKGCVRPGVNITDETDDWTTNYRCPDVVAFLNDTSAVCHDTHWLGGPDFLIEVVSPDDRTRDKLDFYAKVGTREVLLVDRDPWALELRRLAGNELRLVGSATVDNAESVTSEVVGLSFCLKDGDKRPAIAIASEDGNRSWTV